MDPIVFEVEINNFSNLLETHQVVPGFGQILY